VLARLYHPEVAAVPAPLIESGAVVTCGDIEFELGWATRSRAEFDQVRADRDAGYEWMAPTIRTGDTRLTSRPPSGTAGACGRSARPTCRSRRSPASQCNGSYLAERFLDLT
jgi:hypothetical protein